MAQTVVHTIYALANERSDGEGFTPVADSLLSDFLQVEQINESWMQSLQDDAFAAYIKMVGAEHYYFSVGELVWICKAMNVNIVVCQRFASQYAVYQ